MSRPKFGSYEPIDQPQTSGDDPNDEAECAAAAAGLPLRSGFGFTAIENITLDVFRFVCMSYGSGDAAFWHRAYDHAEASFGLLRGADLVARVTVLVRALRIERQGCFRILSAGCCRVCEDELAVQTVIKAARLRETEALLIVSELLAKCHERKKILTAANALARLQEALQSEVSGNENMAASHAQLERKVLH